MQYQTCGLPMIGTLCTCWWSDGVSLQPSWAQSCPGRAQVPQVFARPLAGSPPAVAAAGQLANVLRAAVPYLAAGR
eukprot:941247-Amphidinium_carterae.2